jgi:hypothetical protein
MDKFYDYKRRLRLVNMVTFAYIFHIVANIDTGVNS